MKKERQERARTLEEEKKAAEPESAPPAEDFMHEPIVGRKKKTKKASKEPAPKPAAARSEPAETPKEGEQPPEQVDTQVAEQEPRQVEEQTPKQEQQQTPSVPETPAIESKPQTPDTAIAEDQKKPVSLATTILNELQESGELSPTALNFFRPTGGVPVRSENHHSSLDAPPTYKPLSESELATLNGGKPVRRNGWDETEQKPPNLDSPAHAASRLLITPHSHLCIRGLTKDLEDRLLQLEARIKSTSPPQKYSHRSQTSHWTWSAEDMLRETAATLSNLTVASQLSQEQQRARDEAEQSRGMTDERRLSLAMHHMPHSQFPDYADDALTYLEQFIIPASPVMPRRSVPPRAAPAPPSAVTPATSAVAAASSSAVEVACSSAGASSSALANPVSQSASTITMSKPETLPPLPPLPSSTTLKDPSALAAAAYAAADAAAKAAKSTAGGAKGTKALIEQAAKDTLAMSKMVGTAMANRKREEGNALESEVIRQSLEGIRRITESFEGVAVGSSPLEKRGDAGGGGEADSVAAAATSHLQSILPSLATALDVEGSGAEILRQAFRASGAGGAEGKSLTAGGAASTSSVPSSPKAAASTSMSQPPPIPPPVTSSTHTHHDNSATTTSGLFPVAHRGAPPANLAPMHIPIDGNPDRSPTGMLEGMTNLYGAKAGMANPSMSHHSTYPSIANTHTTPPHATHPSTSTNPHAPEKLPIENAPRGFLSELGLSAGFRASPLSGVYGNGGAGSLEDCLGEIERALAGARKEAEALERRVVNAGRKNRRVVGV